MDTRVSESRMDQHFTAHCFLRVCEGHVAKRSTTRLHSNPSVPWAVFAWLWSSRGEWVEATSYPLTVASTRRILFSRARACVTRIDLAHKGRSESQHRDEAQ
jgi:hypothetical protein